MLLVTGTYANSEDYVWPALIYDEPSGKGMKTIEDLESDFYFEFLLLSWSTIDWEQLIINNENVTSL